MLAIGLIVIMSLALYVIVEGVFYGGWRDPDVRGALAVLKWSMRVALLPIRLIINSLWRIIKRVRKTKPTPDPAAQTKETQTAFVLGVPETTEQEGSI